MEIFSAKELEKLKQIPMLNGLSAEAFNQFISLASREEFVKGEVLLKETEPGECLYLIISGSVGLFKKSTDQEQERIATLTAGQSIGELQIVSNRPCSATVIAETDLTVLSMPTKELRRPENETCYKALLDSIILVLTERLTLGNDSVLNEIAEKKRKARHLFATVLGIIALLILLAEVSFGIFITEYPTDSGTCSAPSNTSEAPSQPN